MPISALLARVFTAIKATIKLAKISNAGNEEKAIQIAQQKLEQCEREGKKKPSEMCPGTTVHRLVGEIRGKANG